MSDVKSIHVSIYLPIPWRSTLALPLPFTCSSGSINVPFLKPALLAGMAPNEAFLKELDDAGVTKSDVIVLACASGKRAAMAAQKLGEEVRTR